MMLLFFFFEAFFEKFKPRFGHQTGATIAVGMCISFILWYTLGESQSKYFSFSSETFFNFFLPPIIFNAGFTMRKRKFFENLGNTVMLGVGATFVTFVIYSLLTWFILTKMNLQMTNYYARKHLDFETNYAQNPAPINISVMQILLMTSLLCSSDTVAVVSIVDYTK